MTGHCPICGLSWALAYVDHVPDLSAVVWFLRFGLSNLVASTEMLGELLTKQAAALNVEREVDRLVRNLHRRLAWIFLLQEARNLLWGPILLEKSYHLGPQVRLDCQLRRLGASPSMKCRPLGTARSIAPASEIPGPLPGDRRWRPANPNCNRAQRLCRSQA